MTQSGHGCQLVSSFQIFQSFRRDREFNRFGQLLMKDPGRATTRPSSPAHLIRREASRCRQPAGRSGGSAQPP
jgi:hypothetical protein